MKCQDCERFADQVEDYIRRSVPASELDAILDNALQRHDTQFMNTGTVSSDAADIMVSRGLA